MRVLWFEVTEPRGFRNESVYLAGWQDSLENIIKKSSEIELFVAFEAKARDVKVVGNVTYIPMNTEKGMVSKIMEKFNWNYKLQNLKKEMQRILDRVNPDIIQVFGTEWPYGHVAELTDKPVVIHIMGALVQYANALYPPGFCFNDVNKYTPFWKIRKYFDNPQKIYFDMIERETQIWKAVKYYMGRTEWDKNLSKTIAPGRTYFHVEEALRSDFFSDDPKWSFGGNSKITLISTGCTTFWKGPDMLLKTAMILKKQNVDFKWIVAGKMDPKVKKCTEKKFRTTFEDNNINLIGMVAPSELKGILCHSTMYVHTAYVENSPNSICEAQILGVPVVSTYVGGIPTLLGEDGIMVPANDPWQMACAIIELANDKEKMERFSKNGREKALKRHCADNVKKQLLDCYSSILNKES